MEDNTNINVNEEVVEATEEVKTYTQDEVLALLQSETDKRVSQALKKQQKKYEIRQNKKHSCFNFRR